MEMKSCPLMTIARSVAADGVVSHGACQREKCAWWEEDRASCAIPVIAHNLWAITVAVLAAAGLEPPPDI